MLVPALDRDLPDIVALVNASYRGESSRQGWTHEADYIDGERTDLTTLKADLASNPGAALFVSRDPRMASSSAACGSSHRRMASGISAC